MPENNVDEITAEEALAALRAASWQRTHEPEIQPARGGRDGKHGDLLYQHACGHVEVLSDSQRAEALGGCDACESGSDDPTDWQPLYRNYAPPPERVIHSVAGGFGADWTLASAEDAVRTAKRLAWSKHLLSHDLTVLTADGRVVRFEARQDKHGAAALADAGSVA